MCIGKELTRDERILIQAFLEMGLNFSQIARRLNRSTPTISREVRKVQNVCCINSKYDFEIAQNLHDKNISNRLRGLAIGNDIKLAKLLDHLMINDGFSPAAAVGAIRNSGEFERVPHATTIYSYIDKGFLETKRYNLPNFGNNRKKNKREYWIGKHTKGTSIEERPQIINERLEFGHFEGDLVLGSKTKGAVVLTLTERLTRLNFDVALPDKTQASVVKGLDMIERYLGNELGLKFNDVVKSITFDNGSEFLDFESLERSCVSIGKRTKTYYAHPFASHERGTNERNNGLLRRFGLKKGRDFRNLTECKLQSITDRLNSYPRKILDYQSSIEVFSKFTGLPKNIRTAFKVA